MEQYYYIGIDLGGTNIKAVAIDKQGKILCEKNIPTESEYGPPAVIKKIISIIDNFRTGKELVKMELTGIGIAVAGVVDMKQGVTKFLPNLITSWKNIPIIKEIEKQSNSKALLINDVRATTLGEKTFGAGQGIENLVCIAVGTGIGGGVVINGKIYFGSEGVAGEIGHQTIEPYGPRCTCGSQGCLEALASGPAICAQAIKLVKQGADTIIRDLVDNDLNKIDPLVVEKAARQGDPVALEIWEREGYYLGLAIANLLVILNPEMIIIGGGIANAADLLFEPIKKIIRQRVFVGPDVEKLKLVRAKLGDKAGAIGAAIWAMLNLSKNN
jgi:glucokinase